MVFGNGGRALASLETSLFCFVPAEIKFGGGGDFFFCLQPGEHNSPQFGLADMMM